MFIDPLDANPHRLDSRLLEDAGLTRIGDELAQRPEDGRPRPVFVETSWLWRLVESVRLRRVRFSI